MEQIGTQYCYSPNVFDSQLTSCNLLPLRTLHFIGTTLVILIALWIILTGSWKFVWVVPACGYGFSWSGHFFFQKNNPAAFKQPFYSLLGDFTMWWEIVTQTIPMYPHELVT